MSISRQQLHEMIDAVDMSEFDVVYHVLAKFIREDFPAQDDGHDPRLPMYRLSAGFLSNVKLYAPNYILLLCFQCHPDSSVSRQRQYLTV